MTNKKQFAWILILAVAILVSAVIIFPSALVFSGNQKYQENANASAESHTQPEEIAEAFYAWYLESFGDPATGTFRSPAYHDSEYLTSSFIGHIDEVLDSFDGMSGYDPFLCAQDIPQTVLAGGTFHHNGQASVVMRTNFPDHFFTVDLQHTGGDWKISNITCAFAPEGVAKAFYTWYLAYIGDPASDNFRNPLVDKAYQESGFLTPGFIQGLDDLTAGGIPADPILMAQDIPNDFTVDPGMDGLTAIVHLQFGTETVRHLKIHMIHEMGNLKINQIEQAP